MAMSDDKVDDDDALGADSSDSSAWKIAYADFTTSMLAILFVLWIIASADSETQKLLALYFSPAGTSFGQAGGGVGTLGEDASANGNLVIIDHPDTSDSESTLIPIDIAEDSGRAKLYKTILDGAGEEGLSDHLRIEKRGNEIEIVLQSNELYPLFTEEQDISPRLRTLLVHVLKAVYTLDQEYDLAIHTASLPTPSIQMQRTEAATLRAQRLLAEIKRLSIPYPQSITALGDSVPVMERPTHPLNDRLIFKIR